MNQDGPIVVAYDGSPAARAAIALAAAHLQKDRKAIVLSVYQPLESVPFIGAPGIRIPSGVDEQIHEATEKLADVRQALLGSVATAVMHNAGRPVAVVPESFVRGD